MCHECTNAFTVPTCPTLWLVTYWPTLLIELLMYGLSDDISMMWTSWSKLHVDTMYIVQYMYNKIKFVFVAINSSLISWVCEMICLLTRLADNEILHDCTLNLWLNMFLCVSYISVITLTTLPYIWLLFVIAEIVTTHHRNQWWTRGE